MGENRQDASEFLFDCPFCGQKFSALTADIGRMAVCPACGHQIVIEPNGKQLVVSKKKQQTAISVDVRGKRSADKRKIERDRARGIEFSDDGSVLIKYLSEPSEESYSIPFGVVRIKSDAFSNCTELRSVIIPDSVTEIGENAFRGCINLLDMTIPPSVTEIGEYAFSECRKLRRAVIPVGVRNIWQAAFWDCESLLSINIPEGVEKICEWAFHGCESLQSATIPGSVAKIGNCAFNGCVNLQKLIIGDGVAIIGDNAFADCENLRCVVIPDSVTKIGFRAFYPCGNLKEASVPRGCVIEHSFSDNCRIVYRQPGERDNGDRRMAPRSSGSGNCRSTTGGTTDVLNSLFGAVAAINLISKNNPRKTAQDADDFDDSEALYDDGHSDDYVGDGLDGTDDYVGDGLDGDHDDGDDQDDDYDGDY